MSVILLGADFLATQGLYIGFKRVIKCSRATGRANWLKGEKSNVSRTVSVLVFRVLMCLENQSVDRILPNSQLNFDVCKVK
jgi:hypothetical protein